VKIWDAQETQESLTLKGHKGSVGCVCFSPDGKRIISGGRDTPDSGDVKVWDSETGREVLSLKGAYGYGQKRMHHPRRQQDRLGKR